MNALTGTTSYIRNARINETGDVAASTATTAVATLGDEYWGTLSSNSDEDWIRVELEAGETYVFTVWGTGGSADGVDDTILTLYNASGNQLMQNDDIDNGNGVYFSRITYTATADVTVYLGVESWNNSERGDYVLEVASDEYSIDQIVNQLAEHGWGFSTGIAFGSNEITVDLTRLTAAGQQLARWALEMWEDMTTLEFTEVTSGADITFDDAVAGSAYAGPDSVNPNTGEITSAIVNVGTSWINWYGTQIGSYSFLTYLHEIGHALGLMHAGAYDGSADYGVDNHYLNDSYQATIMSYFSLVSNTNVDGSDYLPITPMIADVAAIWQLYGTPTDVNSGNTIWGANSNVGGLLGTMMGILFDGDADTDNIYNNDLIGLTIVDTGGIDTVDLSTITVSQTIDMNPGGISDIAGYDGNVVVGLDTDLENLIGGTASDTVYGNSLGNSIDGGAGNDRLFGGGGDDTVLGGNGRDTIWLGDGNDVFNDNAQSSSLGRDTVYGEAGNDAINGAGGTDKLFGGIGDDTIYGGGGGDRISGGGGYDDLYGGWGDDRIYGGYGRDEVWLGGGNDYYQDSDQNNYHGYDTVYGGAGNDTIYGGGGADRLYGGLDDDYIDGGVGADRISAGEGDDYVTAGDGNDLVYGGAGRDTIYLGDGDDVFRDLDDNAGTEGDRIYGGLGDDVIEFAGGDDWANGGAGADTFVWDSALQSGADTIAGFADGVDMLRFEGSVFADLTIADAGVDVLITWANGSVTLTGIDHTLITADDFQFI